eukprot:GHVR01121341.1.p1 GENE.GHVR01121341.1~~GHVR01121341.1.p1  ORF type:complete len:535 (+),score=100.76 GHVR01121341.1:37-1641(+)
MYEFSPESRKRNLDVFHNPDTPDMKRHNTGGRVLLLTITSLVYPVDVDLIHLLFNKYGEILRIALFNRNNKDGRNSQLAIQALVEYADAGCAASAMHNLNGKCIYANCNELEIQYSRLTEIQVKHNNERARDYSDPSLPPGPPAHSQKQLVQPVPPLSPIPNAPTSNQIHSNHIVCVNSNTSPLFDGSLTHTHTHTHTIDSPGRGRPHCFSVMDAASLAAIPTDQVIALHEQLKAQLEDESIRNTHAQRHQIHQLQPIQPHTHTHTQSTHHHMGLPLPQQIGGVGGQHGGNTMHTHGGGRGSHGPGPYGVQYPSIMRDSGAENSNRENVPVVMAHHLPQDTITPLQLFNLFSIYGPVVRVRVLHNKPDAAMIQFSDPFWANIALFFLNSSNLRGSDDSMQLVFSKNKEVKPAGTGDNSSCAKVMSFTSRDQRYRYQDSYESSLRIARNACYPTNTVFVANLPDSADEEMVTELFNQYAAVQSVTMLPCKAGSKAQMAQVTFSSPVDATECILRGHGTIHDGKNIKIAFTRQKVL